jgi:LysR family transcriptional regulator, hydrogen peroxide-inducible genes activator
MKEFRMTLVQLEYALAIDRFKSFSQAAKSCHVAQPSLSAQVQKLEKELGVTIFDRSRNPISTTEVGREILSQARRILDEASRLPEIAHQTRNLVRGSFRLGVIPTIAPQLFPIFLGRFSKAYPEVKLAVEEDKTSHLIAALDRGEIDGAILSTPEEAPASLLEKVLYYEPFVVFAGKKSELLGRKRLAPSELPVSSAILLDETHCMRDQVEQICRAKPSASVSTIDFQSGSLQTLISIVQETENYTFLPLLTANSLSSSLRQSCVREIDKPTPMRKVSLVFHRAHLKRAVLDALAEVIIAALPQGLVRNPRSGQKILDPDVAKFGA